MKLLQKYISVLLVALTILCVCSFSSFASDDLIMSDFKSLMCRSSPNNSGVVTETYYQFTDGIQAVKGRSMHWYSANDSAFYASGEKKCLYSWTATNVEPSHNYDLTFYTCLNYNGSYTVNVIVAGQNVYSGEFSGYYPNKLKVNFDMPSWVSDTTDVRIEMIIPSAFAFGSSGQTVKYYISETVDFVDRTDNPTWLSKIKEWFDNIGNWFINLGNSIGEFFTKLGNDIGKMFTDLGSDIKQKFVDLGENIKSFFITLKNYLLYFQDPVTLNSNGVLVDKYGKPVYTNPFDGPIEKIQNTCDEWILNINNFLNDIDASRIQVKVYLENGSSLVNGVLSAVPILNICLIFAAGFFVIRKVVGR